MPPWDGRSRRVVKDASGFAALTEPDFQLSGPGQRLESATLNTTIPVFDFVSFTSFDVTINLAWTATGPLTRDNGHFHSQGPGFIVNGNFNGLVRPAEASGSVSDGSTNFTPNPSNFAQIASVRSGTVFID